MQCNATTDKKLLTPHQGIGLGQSSRLNRDCLRYRWNSSKGSKFSFDDSKVRVDLPFFCCFFLINFSIHASVDESAKEKSQYHIDNQKKEVKNQ